MRLRCAALGIILTVSLQYLLQAIEAKRNSVKLDDAQLRRLLTEVCKGRDEREEFLESIDRIITELKNYTEHSTAFLSKVSKRDAPDYYDGKLLCATHTFQHFSHQYRLPQ